MTRCWFAPLKEDYLLFENRFFYVTVFTILFIRDYNLGNAAVRSSHRHDSCMIVDGDDAF